jgi:predicted PolB exonuclease-like 3'-5' exonuclease
VSLFDRPIVAFDIETIPDPEIGRQVLGIEGSEEAVILEMARRRHEETAGATAYPQLPWQRIVCVCVTRLDLKEGKVEMFALTPKLDDERASVATFFGLFDRTVRPRIVSWNGGGFDLPVLRYRAMKYGVAARGFHGFEGERQWSNYLNRYHDLHVDVMDVVSGYGASTRVGLAKACQLLGLPAKGFIDGEVYEHYVAGEHARIIEYCKLDTLSTLLVFLAHSVHTGALPPPEFERCVGAVRAAVRAESHAEWREISLALENWPSWGRVGREHA